MEQNVPYGWNQHEVEIPADSVTLPGILGMPTHAVGVVIFAHGSGSGRFSPRNQFVARVLQEAGFATLLLDLLTESESGNRQYVFDIALLARRLLAATDWVRQQPVLKDLPIGYFGASTGAGAALVAAAQEGNRISAVVSRGGRPDLANGALANVTAPTLLIVGGWDQPVIALNEQAYNELHAPKKLVIVPRATHLFEEPGKLEEVAELAVDWFTTYLKKKRTA
ncbi:MAG TPA: dienelactone hydrolase family protein [Chloroflexota bacterium]|nr:dienelactone hydrolase family protein [Chloroflexota bacterium]